MNNNNTTETSEVPPMSANGKKEDSNPNNKKIKNVNRRQGKKSKNNNDDKFRTRINEQERAAHEAYLKRVLCIADDEDAKPLLQVINDVQVVQQPKAKPVTVTTRAVGFSTAVFYDRAMSTWSAASLWDICTIHQMYRVCLWLYHYKLYQAQAIQSERVTQSVLQRIYIADEFRSVLDPIHLVPSALGLILDCVGKITGDQVYHSGYCKEPSDEDRVEWLTLTLNPDNILEALDIFSNVDTPLEVRSYFAQHCPIPGARVVGDLLLNPADVYPPEYGPSELRDDVHCYMNLMTRVQSRLPKHALREYVWSGTASRSGLWSCAIAPICINSHFSQREMPVRRLRDAQDRRCNSGDSGRAAFTYTRSKIAGSTQEYWANEATTHTESVVGMMALVGEECFVATRYELHSKVSAASDPITTLYSLLDAPR